MLILLRQVHRDRKGAESLLEASHEGGVIHLGHRNDQELQLHDPQVAPRHLTLKPLSGARFSVRAVGAARFTQGGQPRRKAVLAPGDSIGIGAQELRVIVPPAGFDGALQLIQTEQDAQFGPATHFQIRLQDTGLRMRGPAWGLALLCALLLALPLAGFFNPALGAWLRAEAPWLSDRIWISGPLARAHHTLEINGDCNACHLRLFEMAPDRGCLACHEGIAGHVDVQQVHAPGLDVATCASCHKEHNEPAMLVRRDSGLCVDCHADLGAVASAHHGRAMAQPVAGFTGEQHPAFQYSLLRYEREAGTWLTERVRPSADVLPQESSNLKFPHDVHLDARRVQIRAEDRGLGCADCHSLDSDGEHFIPITMEAQCRSCHGLGFDEDEPDKQLPHAAVRAAVVALEEHYIRQFADTARTIEVGQRARRRPSQAERDPCPQGLLACGRERAELEAFNQFNRSGCVTCHEVTEHPGRSVYERWEILPVKLVADFHPLARFNHVVHLTRRGTRAEEDANCLHCHAADVSASSSDVLMPGIDNCLACHGEQRGSQNVQLGCVGCHGFHLPGMTPMGPAPRVHQAALPAAGGGP